MNFDNLANKINESVMPEARKPNPEFQKWKAENPGVPVYKFFKMQRAKKLSGAAPEPGIIEPGTTEKPETSKIEVLSKDPATERTRLAVAEYLTHNPGASVDEIIDAIAIDSTEETPLNLDPAVVKAIVDEETPSVGSEPEEPSLSDLKKDELAAKYDRMRRALYKARGFKAGPGRRATKKQEPDMDLGDEEEAGIRRSINMRDEPRDPTEL